MKTKHLIALAVLMMAAISYLPSVKASSPHVPGIVLRTSMVGQTSDVSVGSITVPTGGSDYRITITGVNISGTAGIAVVNYTNDLGAQIVNLGVFNTSQGVGTSTILHAASGTLDLSTVGTVSGDTYNLYVTVEEL